MTPSELAGITFAAIKNSLVDLNVSVPCITINDAVAGHVDVRPSIAKSRMQPDGTRQDEITEIIEEVPIINIGCGGFGIDIPVKAGCEGLLIFCDYDIDNWDLTRVVTPHTARVHDQNDCFFLPAFNFGSNDGDCMIVGSDEHHIEICDDKIDLRSNGDSLIDALKASGALPLGWG